jgi:hypothetical protein
MDKECKSCTEGLESVRQWQDEMMDKHGWYVHFVTDHDTDSPTGYNVHSHGVQESFGHPDLQIVAPLPPELAHSLLRILVDRIKVGESFKPNKKYDKIIRTLSVTFTEAVEGGRTVLRMILPDSTGALDEDAIEEGDWRNQWKK